MPLSTNATYAREWIAGVRVRPVSTGIREYFAGAVPLNITVAREWYAGPCVRRVTAPAWECVASAVPLSSNVTYARE